MRTIEMEKRVIEKLQKDALSINKDNSLTYTQKKRKLKQISNKIESSREIIKYLEINPRIEFIESEAERLSRQLEVIESRYLLWQGESGVSYANETVRRNAHGKLYNEKLIKDKLKFVQKLLTEVEE